jgi:hypothetical protein
VACKPPKSLCLCVRLTDTGEDAGLQVVGGETLLPEAMEQELCRALVVSANARRLAWGWTQPDDAATFTEAAASGWTVTRTLRSVDAAVAPDDPAHGALAQYMAAWALPPLGWSLGPFHLQVRTHVCVAVASSLSHAHGSMYVALCHCRLCIAVDAVFRGCGWSGTAPRRRRRWRRWDPCRSRWTHTASALTPTWPGYGAHPLARSFSTRPQAGT